jgi:uncharacterized HAD superfamily protein
MARIALDIDSTLHHYWDLIDRISQERFGVELPYEEQTDWGITLLERDQLIACVEETHSDENVLSAEPYPDAVETVRAWSKQGHWIHVTSHRSDRAYAATEQWLNQIDMPYDDLHCSYDKIARCVELGIDVLVDDSPINLMRARDEGMAAATIIHPWNRQVVENDGVIGAAVWSELRERLRPVLDGR